MKYALHNQFHFPRRPLVYKTLHCAYAAIAGLLLIALLPVIEWKSIGGFVLIGALARWHFFILPDWSYKVELHYDFLKVGNAKYLWSSFESIKLLREASKRSLHMVFRTKGRRDDILLSDSLENFEYLAQQCFWHANQVQESADQFKTGSKTSTSRTKADG